MKPLLYTTGYAHWTAEALAAKVHTMNAIVLDIRFSPYSRRSDFTGEALKERLGPSSYYHLRSWGNANYRSGGPITPHDRCGVKIVDFRAGLIILKSWEAQGRPFILMCGCSDYGACHRSVIAELLRQYGYAVEELLPDAQPGDSPLRALTLYQPWASLVACGAKQVETRSWGTAYRGPLAIHASKKFTLDNQLLCREEPFRTALLAAGVEYVKDLPRGAVVAVCRLAECKRMTGESLRVATLSTQERAFGHYAPGRYAWLLADIQRLETPIPARGAMGLWTPDGETLTAIRQRVSTLL